MEMHDIMNRLARIAGTQLNESRTNEAFADQVETDPKERGKYAHKDVHELKKELTRVKRQMADYKDHGKTVPHNLRGKFSELTFAIRAKQAGGGKWGAIKEAGCGDMQEQELEELFYYDLPAVGKDRGPRDTGTDELARRERVAKGKKGSLIDPSYKDKDRYGDMYKIAGPKGRLPEGDMEEGNEFSGALAKARATGSATFDVDGKTYKVTEADLDEVSRKEYIRQQDKKAERSGKKSFRAFGQSFNTDEVSEAELDEREFNSKEKFDRDAKPGDTYRGHKGTITKTRSGVTHSKRHDDEDREEKHDDDDDKKEKRSRGRPKGTKGKTGARGPSGRSKLLKMDEDSDDLHDSGEYDREGEMAKQQLHTIDSAAKELHAILDDEENLPEWVQSKITKAMDYLDTARDYMASRDAEDAEDAEQMVPERKLSGSEMKKREEVVKSMKKDKAGFKKRYGERGEEVMYAVATKVAKGEKMKKPTKEESVEETTTAGSVAPTTAEPAKKGKKGMVFGKGVYEAELKENFERRLNGVLAESMSINATTNSDGSKNLTVTASDQDAEALAQLLNLAGMQSSGYESACPACGQRDCGCEAVEEDYANAPDTVTADEDYMVNTLSGGLNGRKSTGQTTLPIINRDPHRQGIQSVAEDVEDGVQSRLWDLYKRIK